MGLVLVLPGLRRAPSWRSQRSRNESLLVGGRELSKLPGASKRQVCELGRAQEAAQVGGPDSTGCVPLFPSQGLNFYRSKMRIMVFLQQDAARMTETAYSALHGQGVWSV